MNWKPENGWFDECDVRKAIYPSLFAGGAGVTYGCHDVWQFWTPDRKPISAARTPWQQALDLPAARQMKIVRTVMERPGFFARVPDQSLIVSAPGNGGNRAIATRGVNRNWAMVYFPTTQPVTIDLSKLAGPVRAFWFNPQNASYSVAGPFDNTGPHEFVPQSSTPLGEPIKDWILMLDAGKR